MAGLFPGIIRMFANGFWAAVWDAIRRCRCKAYGDDNKVYVHFHHHVLDFDLHRAGLMVWGLSPSVVQRLALRSADHHRRCSGHCLLRLRTDLSRRPTSGFTPSCSAPRSQYPLPISAVSSTSRWLGSAQPGAASSLVSSSLLALLLLINPALYLALSCNALFAVGKLGLAGPASNGFSKLNTWYLGRQKAMSELNTSSTTSADQEVSGYRQQYLHVSNLLVTYGVWWLVQHYAVGTGSIWAWPAVVGLPLLSYALIGRTLTHSGKGLPLVSSALGLVAATYVGVAVLSMGSTPVLVSATAGAALFAAVALPCCLRRLSLLCAGSRKSWTVCWLWSCPSYGARDCLAALRLAPATKSPPRWKV